MQPVYFKRPLSDRKAWIDQFIALEPKGGVREIIERIQNGNASNHEGSGTNRWGVFIAESVSYTSVAAA